MWLQGGCPASERPDPGYGLAPPTDDPPTLLPTGSILPVTVYDQHGFRVLFHFARDPLPGRADVLVVVVSMLSTAPQPIRNIVFQSAVPKVTGQLVRETFLPQNGDFRLGGQPAVCEWYLFHWGNWGKGGKPERSLRLWEGSYFLLSGCLTSCHLPPALRS